MISDKLKLELLEQIEIRQDLIKCILPDEQLTKYQKRITYRRPRGLSYTTYIGTWEKETARQVVKVLKDRGLKLRVYSRGIDPQTFKRSYPKNSSGVGPRFGTYPRIKLTTKKELEFPGVTHWAVYLDSQEYNVYAKHPKWNNTPTTSVFEILREHGIRL
jgi:hypothetical protein